MSLDGWTAPRLDDLAQDVKEIKQTLRDMQTGEVRELKQQVFEANNRPRIAFYALAAPVLGAAVSGLIVLLSHA